MTLISFTPCQYVDSLVLILHLMVFEKVAACKYDVEGDEA